MCLYIFMNRLCTNSTIVILSIGYLLPFSITSYLLLLLLLTTIDFRFS
ncbi:hypothetical protein MtrunA17_Chr5g0426791 [Medicago truncatula]|uniref:Transmembrane protein n=1 Tax=Medicago truncatula TaxID=3880 RepID=A0A396HS72_MEDTR|nr:hypothetical protein MtrunA17_Chr5g0426791 [Medicago truncatula]